MPEVNRLLTARLEHDSMNHIRCIIAGQGSVGREFSRKARQVLGPLMGAAMMVYFGYHAVQGDRGLIAWWNLRFEIERAEAVLTDVSAEKKTLERRVSLLRSESLDPDMLEERARIMLGAVHPTDYIVPDAVQ
jgi:cell division protein FtsB